MRISIFQKCPTIALTMELILHTRLHFFLTSPLLLRAVIRLFGGLILDIKRKAPFYLSDFKDGMSLQCVASFLFLYCACMSPVITFGGLLGEATEGRIVRVHSDTHSNRSKHRTHTL